MFLQLLSTVFNLILFAILSFVPVSLVATVGTVSNTLHLTFILSSLPSIVQIGLAGIMIFTIYKFFSKIMTT